MQETDRHKHIHFLFYPRKEQAADMVQKHWVDVYLLVEIWSCSAPLPKSSKILLQNIEHKKIYPISIEHQ